MLCKILIINMLDYKFKRFIFNNMITDIVCTINLLACVRKFFCKISMYANN